MKNIYKYLFSLLIVFACNNDDNLLEDVAVRGGYIQFNEAPTLVFNILELDTSVITEQLIDPNDNATNYSLALYYDGNVINDFVVINSFPAELSFSINDIASALGITIDDIAQSTKFTFVATITTPTGIYSGFSPDLDDNNVNQGGDTSVRLKSAGLLDAIEFDVAFFTPPGKTIKGTSFEEVAVGDENALYTRNGGANEDGDLINGANPPFVDFVSTGGEIGFDSEFVGVPNISTSSLGFTSQRIGVTTALEDVDPFPDGTQAFHIEDPDGAIRITFDIVNVPAGVEDSGISFQYFLRTTSWETLDGIKAYANITTDSGAEVIQLLDALDDNAEEVEGVWNTANSGFLKGVRSYQLVIDLQSGHHTEDIYVDNVIVFEPDL